MANSALEIPQLQLCEKKTKLHFQIYSSVFFFIASFSSFPLVGVIKNC